MDGMPSRETKTTASPGRRRLLTAGLVLRLAIALLISWMIVMAFFATSAK